MRGGWWSLRGPGIGPAEGTFQQQEKSGGNRKSNSVDPRDKRQTNNLATLYRTISALQQLLQGEVSFTHVAFDFQPESAVQHHQVVLQKYAINMIVYHFIRMQFHCNDRSTICLPSKYSPLSPEECPARADCPIATTPSTPFLRGSGMSPCRASYPERSHPRISSCPPRWKCLSRGTIRPTTLLHKTSCWCIWQCRVHWEKTLSSWCPPRTPVPPWKLSSPCFRGNYWGRPCSLRTSCWDCSRWGCPCKAAICCWSTPRKRRGSRWSAPCLCPQSCRIWTPRHKQSSESGTPGRLGRWELSRITHNRCTHQAYELFLFPADNRFGSNHQGSRNL